MSSYEYADRLKETVKNYPIFFLSKSCITSDAEGEVLPSEKQLQELISLCRSLIFPGFYGLPRRKQENLLYHTGINTEKLFGAVLVKQISAGYYYSKKILPLITDSEV